MRKLICDKCNKELFDERIDMMKPVELPYLKTHHGNGSCWQYKKFDLCDDCMHKLNDLIEQTKCDFITKGKEENNDTK